MEGQEAGQRDPFGTPPPTLPRGARPYPRRRAPRGSPTPRRRRPERCRRPSPPRGDPHTRSIGNRGVPQRPHRQQPLLRGDLRLASPQNPSASWIHAGSSSPRGGVCLGLRGPGQAHRRPEEQRKTSIPLLAAAPARRRGRSATTKERKEEHALRHIQLRSRSCPVCPDLDSTVLPATEPPAPNSVVQFIWGRSRQPWL